MGGRRCCSKTIKGGVPTVGSKGLVRGNIENSRGGKEGVRVHNQDSLKTSAIKATKPTRTKNATQVYKRVKGRKTGKG